MMYHAYQAHSDSMWPLRAWARHAAPMFLDPAWSQATGQTSRHAAAACRVLELAEITHARPPWRIDSVLVNGELVWAGDAPAGPRPGRVIVAADRQGAATAGRR